MEKDRQDNLNLKTKTMNTAELRIGNLIKSGNGIYKIYALSSPQILALQEYNEPYGSQNGVISMVSVIIKPIPLTEEWWLKLGAIKDENGDLYIQHPTNPSLRFYLHVDGFVQLCLSWHAPYANYEHVKYVHSFQNLVFATTDTELTIQP